MPALWAGASREFGVIAPASPHGGFDHVRDREIGRICKRGPCARARNCQLMGVRVDKKEKVVWARERERKRLFV